MGVALDLPRAPEPRGVVCAPAIRGPLQARLRGGFGWPAEVGRKRPLGHARDHRADRGYTAQVGVPLGGWQGRALPPVETSPGTGHFIFLVQSIASKSPSLPAPPRATGSRAGRADAPGEPRLPSPQPPSPPPGRFPAPERIPGRRGSTAAG